MSEKADSDATGCAWMVVALMAGIVAVVWIGNAASGDARKSDDERFKVCIEAGGTWDGFWKSCAPSP